MNDPDYVSDVSTDSDWEITRRLWETAVALGVAMRIRDLEKVLPENPQATYNDIETWYLEPSIFQRETECCKDFFVPRVEGIELPVDGPRGRSAVICISQYNLRIRVFDGDSSDVQEGSVCLGTWTPTNVPEDPLEAYNAVINPLMNLMTHVDDYFELRTERMPEYIDEWWRRADVE